MAVLFDDSHSTISMHKELWRYMSAEKFLSMLENNSIYLPTAHKYETSDYNEGKFTERYVNVVRNFVKYSRNEIKIEEGDDYKEYISEDEEVEQYLARVLAARESSFISCWTMHDNENKKLWECFGANNSGVVIKSTISLISEELYKFCDENDESEPYSFDGGPVIYNRMDMHSHLSFENISDCMLPLFFLDENGFEHENEYRFILYNPSEIDELSDELINSINLEGTVQLSMSYRDRVATIIGNVKSVPVDLNNLILEVRCGSAMCTAMEEKIKNAMTVNDIQVVFTRSSL